MSKKKENNPYEKIFDDAHKRLRESGVDLRTADTHNAGSSKRGFIAPFPYGNPSHNNAGWN